MDVVLGEVNKAIIEAAPLLALVSRGAQLLAMQNRVRIDISAVSKAAELQVRVHPRKSTGARHRAIRRIVCARVVNRGRLARINPL